MQKATTNVIIAGVGGQGVLTASDILATAAFKAGCDVKKSEIHGMSQRGGSVTSDVRFGDRVLSPMIPDGTADFLVVVSPDQRDQADWRLGDAGIVLSADDMDPEQLPNKRSVNVALLGQLSTHLTIPESCWLDAIREVMPAKIVDSNLEAFQKNRAG